MVRVDSGGVGSPASAGFMLLELTLALTILLLLFAVVWPVVGRGTNSAQHAAAALDIATLLRADRRTAAGSGQSIGTRFDLPRRLVVGANGRRVTIPRDVTVNITTGMRCSEDDSRFLIRFAPDGTSCGGVVALTRGKQTYEIRINWLSGVIDVVKQPTT